MQLACENDAGNVDTKVPGKVCTVVPQVVPGAALEIVIARHGRRSARHLIS